MKILDFGIARLRDAAAMALTTHAAIAQRVNDGGWSAPGSLAPGASLLAVHGTADNNDWAVRDQGTVFHLTDAGWSSEAVPWSQLLWDVWASPDGEVWATTHSKTVLKRDRDGGWSYFSLPGVEGVDLVRVYGFDNGDVWFVGGNYLPSPIDDYDGGYAFRFTRGP